MSAKRNKSGRFVKASRSGGGGGSAAKPRKAKYVRSKSGAIVRVSGPASVRGMISAPFLTTVAGISGGYVAGGLVIDGVLDWWRARAVKAEKIKATESMWTDGPWVRAGFKVLGGVVVGALGMIFKVGRFVTPIASGFMVNGAVSVVRAVLAGLSAKQEFKNVSGYQGAQLPAAAPAKAVANVASGYAVNGSRVTASV